MMQLRRQSGRALWVWLIVLMLVCYGLLGPLLAVVGSSALATITEVRRTGGTEV